MACHETVEVEIVRMDTLGVKRERKRAGLSEDLAAVHAVVRMIPYLPERCLRRDNRPGLSPVRTAL